MRDVTETRAAREFDAWARDGRGEDMAVGHGDFTRQALDRVTFGPGDRVLDVGCGVGWATSLMLERGAAAGVGVDLSVEMLARARPRPGLLFVRASAAALPFPDGSFSRALSVEAMYYCPDLDAALAEVRRVCADGARWLCVVDMYADNAGSRGWADELDLDMHLLSKVEWAEACRRAGFAEVQTVQLRDRSPVKPEAEFQASRWFPDHATYLAYREAGALVLDARA